MPDKELTCSGIDIVPEVVRLAAMELALEKFRSVRRALGSNGW